MLRAVLVCCIAIALMARPARAQRPFERLFYYVDTENSYASLVRHIDLIGVLGPQVYTVDSLGIVWGSVDARVLDLAKRHGVKVMPLVVNEGFNQAALRRLLADTAARTRAVRTLAAVCRENGFWGIQFDIENVNLEDRDRLTAWYTEAAGALHAAGCTISIAVVHRTEESPGPTGYHRFLYESWRAGYDLGALGRVGDFISLMSYDQQTRRTPPGPIAGLPWMRDNVAYFLRFVPAEKLSLGIPLCDDPRAGALLVGDAQLGVGLGACRAQRRGGAVGLRAGRAVRLLREWRHVRVGVPERRAQLPSAADAGTRQEAARLLGVGARPGGRAHLGRAPGGAPALGQGPQGSDGFASHSCCGMGRNVSVGVVVMAVPSRLVSSHRSPCSNSS